MNELQTVKAGSVEAVRTPERTPEVLGREIRMIQAMQQYMTLQSGIEIGWRLTEAKAQLDHGEWLPYLARETGYSSSTAARYMKLYEQYGAAQISIFGETNFPTLGNLSVSKALALLAVPAEEREEFAAEHDVENISARELEKLLKEKAAAQEEAEKARKEANMAAEAVLAADLAARQAKEELDREREAAQGVAQELSRLREENRELKDRPMPVTVERDEAAIQEAAKATREEEAAEWSKKIEKAQKKLDAAKAQADKYKAQAEKAAGEAREQADGARKDAEERAAAIEAELAGIKEERDRLTKQLRLSSPEATEFALTFKEAQRQTARLFELLAAIRQKDGDTAQRLAGAVRALVEQMSRQIEEALN